MLYDKDIREPLFFYLEERYGRIRILEEKRIAGSRSDIVMITEGEIIGIEIKSDADTYTRLPEQVVNYDRFFDRNILVAGSSHAMAVADHVPEHWGIITVEEVDEHIDFYMLRTPKSNPNMDESKKITMLWRPELANIQEKMGLPKYKNYSKRKIQDLLLSKVPRDMLWNYMCEELFQRDYNEIKTRIDEYRKSNGLRRRRKGYKYKYKVK